jgi:glycosyltransferase involved in cell wall biosynthesis
MTPARPLTVVHFCASLSRAGAEEHVLTLLRGLDRGRFRLYLACPPQLADRMRPDLPPDVGIFPVALSRPWHPFAALRLARFLRRRADIFHVHQFYASMLASPAAHLLSRVPVVIETPHIRELWRSGWKADYRIDRVLGRAVDHYIAVSEANGAYLREVKGLPARKITVIQNGADLSRFDPDRHAPAGFRASIGIGENDPVLVTLGRLSPQKGHRVLIDAMAAVRRDFPHVRLFCIGEGPLRYQLEEHARTLGLDATVNPALPEGLFDAPAQCEKSRRRRCPVGRGRSVRLPVGKEVTRAAKRDRRRRTHAARIREGGEEATVLGKHRERIELGPLREVKTAQSVSKQSCG